MTVALKTTHHGGCPHDCPDTCSMIFDRYTLIRTRFFEVFYKKKGVLNDKQNQKNLYTRI